MLDWFYNNEFLAWWLLIFSVFSFLATLVAVPVILIRLPEDYFSFPHRHRVRWKNRNRFLRLALFIVKNLLGVIFILFGILMLVLPGQGLLTMVIGLVLLEFPGKYKVERWVINRPPILHAINWIRAKAGKNALLVYSGDKAAFK